MMKDMMPLLMELASSVTVIGLSYVLRASASTGLLLFLLAPYADEKSWQLGHFLMKIPKQKFSPFLRAGGAAALAYAFMEIANVGVSFDMMIIPLPDKIVAALVVAAASFSRYAAHYLL